MDEAANHYLRAIELGERRLAIIRRATDLLYEAGRPTEVTQLWNQLPTATLLGAICSSRLLPRRYAIVITSARLDLARKAKAANPGDFRAAARARARFSWLVRARIASAEAEAELRVAVNAVRSDPDRWIILVQFLAQSRQMEKAELAARDAEVALKDKSPMASCPVL